MTTPVSNTNRPAAPRPVAPAANAPAEAAAPRPAAAGDSLTISAAAKATAPQKSVVIDGKEYELREKGRRKWSTLEKVTTFGVTGLGGVVSLFASVAMAAPMSPTGAMSASIVAFIVIGTAIGTAVSYGGGRLLSNLGRGVAGLFDGK